MTFTGKVICEKFEGIILRSITDEENISCFMTYLLKQDFLRYIHKIRFILESLE